MDSVLVVVVVVDVVEVEVVLGLEVEAFLGVILAEVGKVGSIPNILTMVGGKKGGSLTANTKKMLQISEKVVTLFLCTKLAHEI